MSVVVLENVSVALGGDRVLNAVSAGFEAGKLTGIIGPNGAGKTTLMRAVLGLVPLSGGRITILGRERTAWDRTALARHLAYLPQGGVAVWPMRARDVVLLGRLPYRARLNRIRAADEAAVAMALARADATAFAGRRMDTLSAGEQARVLLARALATGAEVLLADEPAAFLDPAHQLALIDLLRAEAARGAAVAVSLHDLSLARRCDKLIVCHNGNVAAAGGPDVLTDDVLCRVFGLSARRAIAEDGSVLVEFNKI